MVNAVTPGVEVALCAELCSGEQVLDFALVILGRWSGRNYSRCSPDGVGDEMGYASSERCLRARDDERWNAVGRARRRPPRVLP
jgi:hypothetical protein